MTETKLTVDEKLDLLNKRIKQMEINSYIHIGIVLIGFLGVASFAALLDKGKSTLHIK